MNQRLPVQWSSSDRSAPGQARGKTMQIAGGPRQRPSLIHTRPISVSDRYRLESTNAAYVESSTNGRSRRKQQAGTADQPTLEGLPNLPPIAASPRVRLSVPLSVARRRKTAIAVGYMQDKVLRPLLENDDAVLEWSKAFFQHPVVFHAFHFGAAGHYDLAQNQLARSTSTDTLTHQIHAIQLLNGILSSPSDHGKLEMALLAVLCLTTKSLDDSQMAENFTNSPLPFDPTFVSNDLKVNGRLDLSEDHARGMFALVARLGGYGRIRIPMLAETIAFGDLIEGSKACRAPVLPSPWKIDRSVFLDRPTRPGTSERQRAPGRGFFSRVPGGLPPECLRVMIHLAIINNVILDAEHEPLSAQKRRALISTRNALQYQLLFLPQWHDMDQDAQAGSDESLYKICRLAALIYSNAVLFGLPPHRGWHTNLAMRLKKELQALDDRPQSIPGSEDLLLWVFFVGGMAAFRSPARLYCESALRDLLNRNGKRLRHWEAVEAVLKEFMWSNTACRHGASVLWVAVS